MNPHLRAVLAVSLILPSVALPQSDEDAKGINRIPILVDINEDCGLAEKRVVAAARASLTRARFEPAEITDEASVYFSVIISCLEDKSAYAVDADFIDERGWTVVRYGFGGSVYGTFDGDADFLLESAEGAIEDAVAELLKATRDYAAVTTSADNQPQLESPTPDP
jgi:hypothetical protein